MSSPYIFQSGASANFDSLSPATTKGDMIAYSTTNARLPVGSNGQVITADSTQTLGVKWAAVGTQVVRSVTTTDSPTNADDVLYLSGASFTVSMFTCTGNVGKIITLIHNGTSLSQVYTINANGGDTGLGVKMHTNGQVLRILVLTTSSWKIIESQTITTPLSYTPTWTALGTVSGEEAYWHRVGAKIYVVVRVTSPGGSAGSEARMSAPSGVTFATVTGAQYAGFVSAEGVTSRLNTLAESGSTYWTFANGTTNPFTKINGSAMWSASGIDTMIEASATVADWLP